MSSLPSLVRSLPRRGTVTFLACLTATILLWISSASAQAPGLVAAYSFNEGSGTALGDSSGNNNTGTLSGATWTTAGKFGNALVFNGTNARVTIPNSASLQLTTGMTLEAWVNPSIVDGAWRDVIYKANDNYYLEATSSNGNKPAGGGTFAGTGAQTYGTAALAVNTWTHLAVTYDGATLRLYVNGVQASSQARTGNLATSTSALQIGGDSTYGQYFTGTIDEVRIYNRALSQAEIQSDMTTPIGDPPPPPPDTTPPTVAITSPADGSSVFGVVSLAATASDNVGIASVQYYLDGAPLGAPIAPPDPYAAFWNATGIGPGSHVLTAVASDFAGNTGTSTPVTVTVSSPPPSAVQSGAWFGPYDWSPLVAVHMALTPTGQVVVWDGQDLGAFSAHLWDPQAGGFRSVPNTPNLFCSGHTVLADGRVLVAGGHAGGYVGIPDLNFFDPTTGNWTAGPPMAFARWYPTTTVLGDGRVLVVSGSIDCMTCEVDTPEIYNPATNTWQQLSNARLALDLYPHMFVLPDGRILASANQEAPMVSVVLDINANSWTAIGSTPLDGGSSAMYQPGKVMKSGFARNPDFSDASAVKTTYVIDMNQTSPAWRQTASMTFARTQHNLTILPDGTVLATGGGTVSDVYNVGAAVLAAELWSPTAETWTTMASMQVPRLYHSTALLLPSGLVLSAGGGRFGVDQPSAELYAPPYLFKGARPTITSTPSQVTYGALFNVQTPDAGRIASVSLIRIGSVTHAINMDQRFLSLSFQVAGGTLTVQAPANGNLAPPGYYMLFILDGNGVPSVAPIIKLQ